MNPEYDNKNLMELSYLLMQVNEQLADGLQKQSPTIELNVLYLQSQQILEQIAALKRQIRNPYGLKSSFLPLR